MTCYIIAQEAAVTLLKEVIECHCRLKDKEQLPLEYDYEIPTFGKDPKDHWGGSVKEIFGDAGRRKTEVNFHAYRRGQNSPCMLLCFHPQMYKSKPYIPSTLLAVLPASAGLPGCGAGGGSAFCGGCGSAYQKTGQEEGGPDGHHRFGTVGDREPKSRGES